MGNKSLMSWLQQIYRTENEEISCSECFGLVSGYVDLEVSGADAADRLPQVKQHLVQCPACRDEYETLRDLRRLEDEQGGPSLDDLRKMIH